MTTVTGIAADKGLRAVAALRRVGAVAALALLLAARVWSADGDANATGTGDANADGDHPNQDYLDEKAELEGFESKRDLELYELNFEALALDHVVIADRTGHQHVYHYLAFRIRNQASDGNSTPLSQAKGYNEVLAAITEQYSEAKKVTDNGTRLDIDGVQGKDATIVQRQDAQSHDKSINLTVFGSDEHGTRIRLLDDPPGTGPGENFAFPDQGDTSVSISSQQVKDAVEEALGRELLSVDQIRALKLPPFDPTKRQDNGWNVGEVYGVALFQRLSDYGDEFTFEVRGLSNKFRIKWPDNGAGKVEDYLDAKLMRRVYVLHYQRLGDEYFRDLDPFVLQRAGWEWVTTFQRNAIRRDMAYTRYFLNNLTNDKDGERNPQVEAEFWPYYAADRATEATDKAQHPNLPDLPDLEATVKAPAGQ
jgi:hypothetical protein